MSGQEEPRMAVINSRTGAAYEAGRGQHRNGEATLGVEVTDAREEEPRRAPPATGLHHQPALRTVAAKPIEMGSEPRADRNGNMGCCVM